MVLVRFLHLPCQNWDEGRPRGGMQWHKPAWGQSGCRGMIEVHYNELPIGNEEANMERSVLPAGKAGRRRFLATCAVGAMGAVATLATGKSLAQPGATRGLRMGLTPAFVHDQHSVTSEWRRYLEAKLGMPVEFVKRDSYRETMDLLHLGKLDFAWLCSYPFVYLRDLVKLVAVPLNQGRPYYRSYLIVSAEDNQRQSMADLKGSVFAFSDPYSNTGYLAPRYQVRQLGSDPASFFRKTFFTWSHRKAIEAVATGMADGAAIDSYVWETLARVKPDLTRHTRIIDRSPEFGFPPIVAHRSVPPQEAAAMRKVLVEMPQDLTGKMLLDRLNIDGFVAGERRMYDSVATMMRAFGEG
jgi:phosphonate transport system substrate-binding protein